MCIRAWFFKAKASLISRAVSLSNVGRGSPTRLRWNNSKLTPKSRRLHIAYDRFIGAGRHAAGPYADLQHMGQADLWFWRGQQPSVRYLFLWKSLSLHIFECCNAR